MLDLYFLDRSATALPASPDGLHYAVSIDLDFHRALRLLWKECERAGVRLGYFEDSLLSVAQIESVLAIFNAHDGQPGSDHPAFAVVQTVLATAKAKGSALAAYCD